MSAPLLRPTFEPASDAHTFDARGFVPEEVRNLDNPQTAMPRIAKDERLIRLIGEAVQRIPTRHELHLGDARFMDGLAPESLHMVVTSPP